VSAVADFDGTVTIGQNGQSILYTAPATGTSDPGTYTINDGINSSATATITVTLTSY